MSVWGIVVAAGSGTRFGGAKHTVELGGIQLWRRARSALLEGGVDEVIVVGPVPGGVPGGGRRQDSVAAGLEAVPAGASFVLVHDSARPLGSPALTHRVLDRLGEGDVDGVVPAMPVRDTLKAISGEDIVMTHDRTNLVAVQTPQGFRRDTLVQAHAEIAGDATDDAAMVEAIGGRVVWIRGESTNLKVTYPDDLVVMEALL